MKNYFIDKLTESKNEIKRLEKSIIQAATNMEMKSLVSLPKTLIEQKKKHSELINDLCKYCSVGDVIEISNLKDKYSQETLNLISENNVRHFYRFNTDGITPSERDALVSRFGYSLKESKIF